jgi:hypothetical protein
VRLSEQQKQTTVGVGMSTLPEKMFLGSGETLEIREDSSALSGLEVSPKPSKQSPMDFTTHYYHEEKSITHHYHQLGQWSRGSIFHLRHCYGNFIF